MGQAAHQIDSRLTAISLAVPNTGYVAQELCPEVDVGGELFKYRRFALDHAFAIEDDRIGEHSRAAEVNFASELLEASTKDRALKAPVSQKELDRAANGTGPRDPQGTKAMQLTQLRDNAREKRVSDFLTTEGNYASGYSVDLSDNAGAAQWDQADQDILGQYQDAIESMLIMPNTAWFSRAAWSAACRNGSLLAAAYPLGGNASAGGILTPAVMQGVLMALGIERIIIGDARYNTAKKGQTRSLSRFMGAHAGLLRVDAGLVSTDTVEPSFFCMATNGPRIVRTWEDPDMGARGGMWVEVADDTEIVQFSNEAGYLFLNAVS